MFSEKNMYADLNRFGAPGAFLNLVLWVFFAVDMMLMSFKFSGVDFMNGYGDENETVSVPCHLGFLGTSPPEKSFWGQDEFSPRADLDFPIPSRSFWIVQFQQENFAPSSG